MTEENNQKYVSSRGIMKSCDVYSTLPISSITQMHGYDASQFQMLREGSLIYICSTALRHFIEVVLPHIKTKFILVSGDCDISVSDLLSPSELENFTNHPLLIRWYSQNCTTFSYKKIRQIPIGLDYHTMVKDTSWGAKMTPAEQEALLVETREKAPPLVEKIGKAYANFHFSLKGRYCFDRREALNQLNKECVFYEPTQVERKTTWENQVKYAFVISPHGNGLDCHRTWEALCLGCIPIVKTSPLDFLYEGLPVLIVNRWSDISPELLERTQRDYSNRVFSYGKLRLSYWMDIIRGEN